MLGRFVQADLITKPENPQSWNTYAYCLNNPLQYTDPSGYLPDDLIKEYVGTDLGAIPEEVLRMLRALHFGEYLAFIRPTGNRTIGQAALDEGRNLGFLRSDGEITSISRVIDGYKNGNYTGFQIWARLAQRHRQEEVGYVQTYQTGGCSECASYEVMDETTTDAEVFWGWEIPMTIFGTIIGDYAPVLGIGKWAARGLGGFAGFSTSSLMPKNPGYAGGDRTLTTTYRYGNGGWVNEVVIRGDQVIVKPPVTLSDYAYLKTHAW